MYKSAMVSVGKNKTSYISKMLEEFDEQSQREQLIFKEFTKGKLKISKDLTTYRNVNEIVP